MLAGLPAHAVSLTLDPTRRSARDITLSGSPPVRLIDADQVSSVAMNLRVHDVTRDGLNYGTEIRLLGERLQDEPDHVRRRPTDARFRNTLRIYGESPIDVLVTVGDLPRCACVSQADSRFQRHRPSDFSAPT